MVFHRYVLYGLGVHSQIPLWGDGDADCPNDVTVRWHRNAEFAAAGAQGNGAATGDVDEIGVSWPDVCKMSVRSGTELVVQTREDSESSHLRHLVSGIGLGLALYQRGIFTLHASAVAIDGRSVVIMGPKGAGKSTLAAALSSRGHLLVSDDVVALDLPDEALPRVRVGAPSMNLWPDSAIATGHDPSTLSQIWSRSPKLAGRICTAQPAEPVPLSAIFSLSSNGGSPQPEKLAPIEAFTQLVGHSHAFRWIEGSRDLPQHLAQCRKVLEHVPVFRLERSGSLDSLAVFARRVEESIALAG